MGDARREVGRGGRARGRFNRRPGGGLYVELRNRDEIVSDAIESSHYLVRRFLPNPGRRTMATSSSSSSESDSSASESSSSS